MTYKIFSTAARAMVAAVVTAAATASAQDLVGRAPVADTWLVNDENAGPTTTHGGESRIQLRNHPVRKRIAYFRYDISDVDPTLFSSAVLSGNFEGSSYNGPGGGSFFNVYGLNDSAAATGGLMGNNWNEVTTSYSNASGVDQSAPINSFGFTSDMTLLGTLSFDGVDVQPLAFLSNTTDLPLSAFLNADTDGMVTFAMISPDTVDSEYRIRTREYGFANGQTPILLNFALATGDVDGANGVDLNDLQIIANHFRQSGNRFSGDLTGNGFIDFDDFDIWKKNYPGTLDGVDLGFLSAKVPEPNSVVLALFGTAGISLVLRYRRLASCFGHAEVK